MARVRRCGLDALLRASQRRPAAERGLHHVLSLKASLAEIMVAAGVDPNTPLEDAVDEFGDAQQEFRPGRQRRAHGFEFDLSND